MNRTHIAGKKQGGHSKWGGWGGGQGGQWIEKA